MLEPVLQHVDVAQPVDIGAKRQFIAEIIPMIPIQTIAFVLHTETAVETVLRLRRIFIQKTVDVQIDLLLLRFIVQLGTSADAALRHQIDEYTGLAVRIFVILRKFPDTTELQISAAFAGIAWPDDHAGRPVRRADHIREIENRHRAKLDHNMFRRECIIFVVMDFRSGQTIVRHGIMVACGYPCVFQHLVPFLVVGARAAAAVPHLPVETILAERQFIGGEIAFDDLRCPGRTVIQRHDDVSLRGKILRILVQARFVRLHRQQPVADLHLPFRMGDAFLHVRLHVIRRDR